MAEQENISVRLSADVGPLTGGLREASRQTNAFGVAGTKAGQAVAAALKQANQAAKDAAAAQNAVKTATAAAQRTVETYTAGQSRLNEVVRKATAARVAEAKAQERVNKLRAEGKTDQLARAEAQLATRSLEVERAVGRVRGATAALSATRAAVPAMNARIVQSEAALAAAQARVKVTTDAVAVAQARLGATRGLGAQALARDFMTLANTSDEVRTSMSNVAAIAGGALAVGLGASLFSAAQLEARLRNVSTIAPVVGENIEHFAGLMLDMSKTVPQSANQLAEGFYDIVSSGFAADDAVRVLEASSKAASAGLTDTATAARAITSVLNAYGLSAAHAAEVSDIMFATVNAGIITFEQLSNQLGDFVGLAAAAGVGFADAASAMATITRSGVPAAQAATGVQNVIRSLVRPSENLSAALRDVGYTSGIAALEADGLRGTITKLAGAQGMASDTAARLFPDIEAVRAVLGLTANEGRNWAEVADVITNKVNVAQATAKAFAEQQQSAVVQMKLMRNEFMAASTELGMGFLPALKAGIGLLDTLAAGIGAIPGPVKLVAGVMAGLAAATLLSGAAAGRAATQWTAFTTALTAARVGGSALPAVMAGASLALTGVGAALAVGALAYGLYAKDKAKAEEMTRKFTQALKDEREGLEGAVDSSIIDMLVTEDDLGHLQTAGVDVSKFIGAVQGSAEEYQALLDQLQAKRDDHWYGSEAFWTSNSRAVDALQDQRRAWEDAQKAQDETADASLRIAVAQAEAGNSTAALTMLLERNTQGNVEYNDSQKTLIKGFEDLASVSKAAGVVFSKNADMSSFSSSVQAAEGSVGKFLSEIKKNNKTSEKFEKDLQKLQRRAPELAGALREMGVDSAVLTAKMAGATDKDLKKIREEYAKLAPETRTSLEQFNDVLREQIEAQLNLQNNRAILAARGYSALADQLMEAGGENAAKLIEEAAKASDEVLRESSTLIPQVIGESAVLTNEALDVLNRIALVQGRETIENLAAGMAGGKPIFEAKLAELQRTVNDVELQAQIAVLMEKGSISEADLKRIHEAVQKLPPEKRVMVGLDGAVKAQEQAQDLLGVLTSPAVMALELEGVQKAHDDLAGFKKAIDDAPDSIDCAIYTPGIEPATDNVRILKESFDKLPEDIKTRVREDGAVRTKEVIDGLDEAMRRLKDQEVSINVGANWGDLSAEARKEFHGVGQANGGVLNFFADGSEHHVAQIAPAGSWRVWAEPETGGEAYIPLAPQKRERSEAILADVASRFGYSLEQYANGGLVDRDVHLSTEQEGVPSLIRNVQRTQRQVGAMGTHIKDTLEALLGPGSLGNWTRPVDSYAVSMGYLGYPGHYGIDLAGPVGTPIRAAAGGRVTTARYMNTSYGNHVRIQHPDGTSTLYAHMNSLDVGTGMPVNSGQMIGTRGSTGNSTGPHLHFETRVNGGPQDPRSFMGARGISLRNGGIFSRFANGGTTKKKAEPKPRALPMLDANAVMDYATDDLNRFSMSRYTRGLRNSVRTTDAWRRDLTRVASKAGADVAAILEDMGAEGVALTHKMATGTKREVEQIANNLRRLAPEAQASLGRFNATLKQENSRTAAFERNLTALASRGYGELAQALAEQNDPEAQALAKQAVNSKKGAAAAQAALKTKNKLLGEDLGDLLSVMTAIRSSKGGIHEVADATGLGEDRIIILGNRGLSRIRAMGAAANDFRYDLSRANKQLSYAEGGMHVAQVAHSTRVWAEPETGGEAYIPLGLNKRNRSTRILGDVAKHFGYGLTAMANGGVLRGRAIDAVSPSSRVVVVERDGGGREGPLIGSLTIPMAASATPRQVGEEMLYQIRRARRGGRA